MKPILSIAGMTAAVLALAAALPARVDASDVDIGERAGEVIGEIAQVTEDFSLTDLPGNLQIEANEMIFDYDRGELRYGGNVQVVHGDVRMRADRMVLKFNPGRVKSLKLLEAIGKVEVLRGEERAVGDHATYDPDRRIITLTGKASLGSGANSIGGESVVVYLAERRAEVKGGNARTGESGRVRAVIDPESLDLLNEPKKK
jgi:lipopolysaccharide export system protein LptA